MDVLVRLEDHGSGDVTAVGSLVDWLRVDPKVSRAAQRIDASTSDDPERLGDTFEVINLVLTHLEALSAIVIAVASWLDSRAKTPPVRIQVDHRYTVMKDGSAESIRKAKEELSASADDQADGNDTQG